MHVQDDRPDVDALLLFGQAKQDAAPVSDVKVFAGHGEHDDDPADAKLPAVQRAQARLLPEPD